MPALAKMQAQVDKLSGLVTSGNPNLKMLIHASPGQDAGASRQIEWFGHIRQSKSQDARRGRYFTAFQKWDGLKVWSELAFSWWN
jgi:hypothetical protein